MPLPKVGTEAPDFTAETDTGVPLTLSSLRGRPIVLFFYPKDNTPLCTTEACGFRDAFPAFDASRAIILGVSADTVRKHANFKRKYALPYTLIADVDHAISKAYGVWQKKTLFGHKYMGIVRTTFVIDAAGRIASVLDKVTARTHADDVMAAISMAVKSAK